MKETCDQLKLEIAERSKLLSLGPELVAEYKKQLIELNAKRTLLIKEREEIFNKLNESRKEQLETSERNVAIRTDITALQQQQDDYEKQYQEKRREIEKQKMRKLRADEESKKIKHEIDEINQVRVEQYFFNKNKKI